MDQLDPFRADVRGVSDGDLVGGMEGIGASAWSRNGLDGGARCGLGPRPVAVVSVGIPGLVHHQLLLLRILMQRNML